MASESVTAVQKADRIHELTYMALGILGTVRAASLSKDNPPAEESIDGACWAVEAMLREISNLATVKGG